MLTVPKIYVGLSNTHRILYLFQKTIARPDKSEDIVRERNGSNSI